MAKIKIMHFEFDYTKTDLAKSSQQIDKRGRVRNTRRVIYAWLTFVAVIFAINIILNPHDYQWVDPRLPPQNLWVTLVPSLTPATIFLLAILFFAFDNWRRTHNASATRSSPVDQPPLRSGTLILMLPFAFMIFPYVKDFTINWNPTPSGQIWVSLLPWIIFAILFALIGVFNRQLSMFRNFAQRRSMLRPQKIEFNADAVIIEAGPSYSRLEWSAFDRYAETINLIKLITEDEATIILPKRAVPDPDTLDALRALIQTKIPKGTFLEREGRFQVLPRPVLEVPAN